jgi:hypothetical protein
MSLREAELSRSRHAQRSPVKQQRKRPKKRHQRKHRDAPLPAVLTPDQVLTFNQWTRLNSISERVARSILRSGKGPRVVQLTPRRIGIRVSDNRAWQDARLRGSS